jgi:hypothetical protein
MRFLLAWKFGAENQRVLDPSSTTQRRVWWLVMHIHAMLVQMSLQDE